MNNDLVRRWRATGGRGRKLRGLIVLLAPYKGRVALMFLSLVIATGAALAPPPLAKLAIDEGIVPHDMSALTWIVVAFLVSAAAYWAATYAQTYLVGWVGQRTLADLRIRIFTHLQSQPIGFYESRPAGVLISRMTNDVEALESLVTDSVVTLFQSGLTLIGAIYITLVCLLPEFLIVYWHVPFYFGGTSLLIIVVVVMDLMAQIQAHLMSHQYDSLLKKANLKGGRPGGLLR